MGLGLTALLPLVLAQNSRMLPVPGAAGENFRTCVGVNGCTRTACSIGRWYATLDEAVGECFNANGTRKVGVYFLHYSPRFPLFNFSVHQPVCYACPDTCNGNPVPTDDGFNEYESSVSMKDGHVETCSLASEDRTIDSLENIGITFAVIDPISSVNYVRGDGSITLNLLNEQPTIARKRRSSYESSESHLSEHHHSRRQLDSADCATYMTCSDCVAPFFANGSSLCEWGSDGSVSGTCYPANPPFQCVLPSGSCSFCTTDPNTCSLGLGGGCPAPGGTVSVITTLSTTTPSTTTSTTIPVEAMYENLERWLPDRGDWESCQDGEEDNSPKLGPTCDYNESQRLFCGVKFTAPGVLDVNDTLFMTYPAFHPLYNCSEYPRITVICPIDLNFTYHGWFYDENITVSHVFVMKVNFTRMNNIIPVDPNLTVAKDPSDLGRVLGEFGDCIPDEFLRIPRFMEQEDFNVNITILPFTTIRPQIPLAGNIATSSSILITFSVAAAVFVDRFNS